MDAGVMEPHGLGAMHVLQTSRPPERSAADYIHLGVPDAYFDGVIRGAKPLSGQRTAEQQAEGRTSNTDGEI
jgi:hypothetical protein